MSAFERGLLAFLLGITITMWIGNLLTSNHIRDLDRRIHELELHQHG